MKKGRVLHIQLKTEIFTLEKVWGGVYKTAGISLWNKETLYELEEDKLGFSRGGYIFISFFWDSEKIKKSKNCPVVMLTDVHFI